MEVVAQTIGNSVIASAAYVLYGLGFNLAYGPTKFANMAYGAYAAFGAYVVFFLARWQGFDLWLAAVTGILAAGFFGYITYGAVYRTLMRRKSSNLILFLGSLGIFTLTQAVVSMIFTAQFFTFSDYFRGESYQILGAAFSLPQMILVVVSLLVAALVRALLHSTAFGKAVRAISDDEEVARITGIDIERVLAVTFFLSAVIAGCAGILAGFDVGVQPTMGLFAALAGAIVAIIGGIGNVYGGMAAAFVLGFAENFGVLFVSGEWKSAIAFGLLLLVLIFRPAGIFSRRTG